MKSDVGDDNQLTFLATGEIRRWESDEGWSLEESNRIWFVFVNLVRDFCDVSNIRFFAEFLQYHFSIR